ncbi:MAG: acyl-CoA synthetase [Acidobacteria bacterium]|nr:acyl-CoA synthetase [Acidobacteriota bacterium]
MDMSLTGVVRTVATTVPDHEAIVQGDTRRTYAELLDRVDRIGGALHARGLGLHTERSQLADWESGQDHLALYLHNCPAYLECMLGAYAARVAPFNVNYRYVADELRHLLADAGARGIVFHSVFAATLAEVLGDLPDLTVLLQVPDSSGAALLPGAEWFDDAVAASPGRPPVDPSPDDLYILYTGGTTGLPKGVLWRQGDIYPAALGGRRISTGEEYADLDAIAENARRGGLRVLPSAPFMHGAAHWMALTALHNGNTVVLPSDATAFDPADLLDTVEREHVGIALLVGDSFGRPILDELPRRARDLSSLTLLISGGAALSAPVKSALLQQLPGVAIMDGLGSSEAGQQATHLSRGDRPVSSGTFTPGTGMTIVSADLTRLLAPGDDELGWLAQRGRVPLGYLGDAEKTARTFPTIDGERFSVPGDRARFSAEGLLELHGRDSVTINSGGEKIFAEEVEAALADHPAVYDVIVTGRPSPRWGQEVVALVQFRAGSSATIEELLDTCGRRLARYKLPKDIIPVDRVVRSPAGKADYRWATRIAAGDL